MTTPFSAAAPALGYLYQARRALLEILMAPDDAEIIIEGLDDLEISSTSSKLTLEQLKHHVRAGASLTDHSPDLWKTIRVWATSFKNAAFTPSTTRLALLTTATAPENSIASLLRNTGRDAAEATARLRTIASEGANSSLTESYKAFLELTHAEQKSLVGSIEIFDQVDDITSTGDAIKKALRLTSRPQFVEAIQERLEGWWFNQVVAQLRNSIDGRPSAIPMVTVRLKLADIAEQFHEDSLPIDFLSDVPPLPDAALDARMFVKQIRAVTTHQRRVEYAITDYYRAFAQRARWLRDELLLDTELDEYESRLFEEWDRARARLEDELGLNLSDSASCDSFGKKLLGWMEDSADVKIRPRVTEGYVMRGSFHMLADDAEAKIWWHPLFLERLRALSR